MSNPVSRVAAIEALLKKATPGPWHVRQEHHDDPVIRPSVPGDPTRPSGGLIASLNTSVLWNRNVTQANAALIVALVNAAPALVRDASAGVEMRRERDEAIEVAREGLRHYMREWSEENWCAGWLMGLPDTMWKDAGDLYRRMVKCVGGTWDMDKVDYVEKFAPGFHDADIARLDSLKGAS